MNDRFQVKWRPPETVNEHPRGGSGLHEMDFGFMILEVPGALSEHFGSWHCNILSRPTNHDQSTGLRQNALRLGGKVVLLL